MDEEQAAVVKVGMILSVKFIIVRTGAEQHINFGWMLRQLTPKLH